MIEWISVICIGGMLYNLERPAPINPDHKALYVGWSYPTGEPCVQSFQHNGEGIQHSENKFTHRMKARKGMR